MTVVALLANPPREGLVLPALVEDSVLSEEEARELYAAMVQDAAEAVARSGGELLVNHPPAEAVPGGGDPAADLREVVDPAVADAVESPDDVRYEVQVGSTESARIGNTLTHLLENEGATSAAVLRPTAPLVDRPVVDGAAMKLRRDDVVLGPAPDGRIYYAGFADTIDFEDAFAAPAVRTLAQRAADAGHGVAFQSIQPLIERPADLDGLTTLLDARTLGGTSLPPATATVLADLDRIVDPFE